MPRSTLRILSCALLGFSALANCDVTAQAKPSQTTSTSPSTICTPTSGPNAVQNSHFSVLNRGFPLYWSGTGNVKALPYPHPGTAGNHFVRLTASAGGTAGAGGATLVQQLNGLVPNATYLLNADFSIHDNFSPGAAGNCTFGFQGVLYGYYISNSTGFGKLYGSFTPTSAANNNVTISLSCTAEASVPGNVSVSITSVSVSVPDAGCAFELQVVTDNLGYEGYVVRAEPVHYNGKLNPAEAVLRFTADTTYATRFLVSDDGYLLWHYRAVNFPRQQGFYAFMAYGGNNTTYYNQDLSIFGWPYVNEYPLSSKVNWIKCTVEHTSSAVNPLQLQCLETGYYGRASQLAIYRGQLALETGALIAASESLPIALAVKYVGEN